MEPETARIVMTGETASYRPRISRETRRLLMTALLAVLTLWILARIRFPDRPVNPNPVPPVLSQLTGGAGFSDLSSAIDDLRRRLGPSLIGLVPAGTDIGKRAAPPADRVPALRIRDDLAVVIRDAQRRAGEEEYHDVVAEDRASGLALIRAGNDTRAVLPAVWSPQRLERPRYVVVSSPSLGDVSLRPVFLGSLTQIETPQWFESVWALPRDADVEPGTFLFTDDAELVGVVTRYEGGLAVVPGALLLMAADDLLQQPLRVPVDFGIDVELLTPRLSIATGAETGVVVAWVDPLGVAVDRLTAGDVIQTVDGVNVLTPEQWRVRMARVGTGDSVALEVIRAGAQRDVLLVATPPVTRAASSLLGLTMRQIARVGAEVVRVDRGSIAEVAGIEAGDVITAIGDIATPTPSRVRSTFASTPRGGLLLVALTRGPVHRVLALQR